MYTIQNDVCKRCKNYLNNLPCDWDDSTQRMKPYSSLLVCTKADNVNVGGGDR